MTADAQLIFMIMQLVLKDAPSVFSGLKELIDTIRGAQKSSTPLGVADLSKLAAEKGVDLHKVAHFIDKKQDGVFADVTAA